MSETMNTGLSPEERKRRDDIMKKAASTLGITVEEVKKRLLKILEEKSGIQELADHFVMHPEQLESSKTLREAGPEIAELEEMISSFESTHSLTELHAIVDISPELAIVFEFTREMSLTSEQLEYSLRHVTLAEPIYAQKQREKITAAKTIILSPKDVEIYNKRLIAKRDLALIIEKLNSLRGNKRYEELKEKCKYLQKAVGSMVNKKVNHE